MFAYVWIYRKQPVVDIFFYLFEQYNTIKQCPDAITLARRLAYEGFEEDEVKYAVACVEQLREPLEMIQVNHMNALSQRLYHPAEYAQMGNEAIRLISSLEHAGNLTATQREQVIERCMRMPSALLHGGWLRTLLLMVLWADNQEIDDKLLHNLIDELDDEIIH